jgi:hypothetical protein
VRRASPGLLLVAGGRALNPKLVAALDSCGGTLHGHSPGAIWRPPAFWLHRKAPEHPNLFLPQGRFQPSQPIDGLCLGRETESCYRLLLWARMRARGRFTGSPGTPGLSFTGVYRRNFADTSLVRIGNRSLKAVKTMTPMIAAEASVEISAPRGSRNGIYGMSERSGPASVRLDVEGPVHLAPLFGFVGDELSKVGGRTCEHRDS